MIAFHAGQHESAVERIRKAIAIRGNEASYHSNLGAVFQAQRMLEEAIGCYERALELKPDYVEAYNTQVQVFGLRGDFVAAAEHFGACRWIADELR